ncbi:MAG: hypothetical protein IV090_25585 [Candidatus Sericytochromatia bacterium]|nr:hypothetical protein [Candidatus Sericytochromatia bacterium]
MSVRSPIKRMNEYSTVPLEANGDNSTTRIVEILQNRSNGKLLKNRRYFRNRTTDINNDTEIFVSNQEPKISSYNLRFQTINSNHSSALIQKEIDRSIHSEKNQNKANDIDSQFYSDEIIEKQINERQDALDFLIYLLILQRKNKRLATKFIMKFMDDEFLNNEFKNCDNILLEATSLINILTDSVILSLLSISYNAKDRLNNRKKFYDVSLEKFIEKYPPGHSKLIFNLA